MIRNNCRESDSKSTPGVTVTLTETNASLMVKLKSILFNG